MAMELLKKLEIMARDQHLIFESAPTCSDSESGDPLFASLWEAKNALKNLNWNTPVAPGSPLCEEVQKGHGLGLFYVTGSASFDLESNPNQVAVPEESSS